jgi:hypothetical protein
MMPDKITPEPVRLHEADENGDYHIEAYREDGTKVHILIPDFVFDWTDENRQNVGLNTVTVGHYQ